MARFLETSHRGLIPKTDRRGYGDDILAPSP